jgi:hypothetical protein
MSPPVISGMVWHDIQYLVAGSAVIFLFQSPNTTCHRACSIGGWVRSLSEHKGVSYFVADIASQRLSNILFYHGYIFVLKAITLQGEKIAI